MHRATFLAILVALIPAADIGAQEPDAQKLIKQIAVLTESRPFQLTFKVFHEDETATIEELLAQYAAVSGRRFIYNPAMMQRGRVRVRGVGRTRFRRSEADMLFQGILRTNNLALVPVGGPELDTWAVEIIESSRILKSLTRPVPAERINEARRTPAEVVMTVVHLKHARASEVRQAIRNMLQSRTAEFYHEVRGVNSLLICGFGPTVANIVDVVKLLDVPVEAKRRSSGGLAGGGRSLHGGARLPKKSVGGPASKAADDMVNVFFLKELLVSDSLARLLEASVGGAFKAVADERTNSVVLRGAPEQLKRALRLLKSIDPARKDDGGGRRKQKL